MRILAIDPTGTHTGGAALRDNGRTVGFAAWTLLDGGWRLKCGGASHDWQQDTLPSLHAVGAHLLWSFKTFDVLVVEGLEPPKDPRKRTLKSTRDLITLAEGLGQTTGPLVSNPDRVLRPTASEWRAATGHAKSSGHTAENAAIAVARREGWLPRWTVAEQGACSEANGMATWAEREAF
jgi:hypothetical protein